MSDEDTSRQEGWDGAREKEIEIKTGMDKEVKAENSI